MTQETPSLREFSELQFVVEHTTPERIFEAYTTERGAKTARARLDALLQRA